MKLLARKNWENGIMHLDPQPTRVAHVEKYASRKAWECDYCARLFASEDVVKQHSKREHANEIARYHQLTKTYMVKHTLLETENNR